MSTLTTEIVTSLKAQLDAAHVAYSKAYAERQAADKLLGAAAGKRADIVKWTVAARRALHVAERAAIAAGVEGGKPFAPAISNAVAITNEISFLTKTLEYYSLYPYADSEHAVLVTVIEELERQLRAEELRSQHHEYKLQLALGGAAQLNGAPVESDLGGIAEAMRQNVFAVSRNLTAARLALKHHDRSTLEARDRYEKEQHHEQ
jgi:hypothetical protein